MKIQHNLSQSVRRVFGGRKGTQTPEATLDFNLENLRARVFFGGLLLLLTILLAYMFRPFFGSFFLSIVFAALLHPVYRRVHRKVHSTRLATVIMVGVLFVLIVLPFVFVARALTTELIHFSQNINVYLQSPEYQTLQSNITKLGEELGISVSSTDITNMLKNSAQDISSTLVSLGVGAISSITMFVINLTIFVSLYVYLIPRLSRFKRFALRVSPLGSDITSDYLNKVHLLMRGTVVGSFCVSFCASTLMGLTFWLLGIPNPAFFAAIAFVIGFIPFLGTPIFTFTAAAIFALMGNYLNAAILLVLQLAILNQLDLVFRPITLPKKVRIHPALTIIAVIAGLAAFGIIGIFYGLILLVLFISSIEIYQQNFAPKTPTPPSKG